MDAIYRPTATIHYLLLVRVDDCCSLSKNNIILKPQHAILMRNNQCTDGPSLINAAIIVYHWFDSPCVTLFCCVADAERGVLMQLID